MTLEEIHDMWEKDSRVDIDTMHEESLKIDQLHSKYTKVWSKERLAKIKLESELKVLRKDKYEFYTQGPSDEHLKRGWEYPGGKILKNEADFYLEADNDIINLSLKVALQKEKVELLDSIIRTINNRSFQIRNAIEFLKWSHGEN